MFFFYCFFIFTSSLLVAFVRIPAGILAPCYLSLLIEEEKSEISSVTPFVNQ